jgi:hypothetical protein
MQLYGSIFFLQFDRPNQGIPFVVRIDYPLHACFFKLRIIVFKSNLCSGIRCFADAYQNLHTRELVAAKIEDKVVYATKRSFFFCGYLIVLEEFNLFKIDHRKQMSNYSAL